MSQTQQPPDADPTQTPTEELTDPPGGESGGDEAAEGSLTPAPVPTGSLWQQPQAGWGTSNLRDLGALPAPVPARLEPSARGYVFSAGARDPNGLPVNLTQGLWVEDHVYRSGPGALTVATPALWEAVPFDGSAMGADAHLFTPEVKAALAAASAADPHGQWRHGRFELQYAAPPSPATIAARYPADHAADVVAWAVFELRALADAAATASVPMGWLLRHARADPGGERWTDHWVFWDGFALLAFPARFRLELSLTGQGAPPPAQTAGGWLGALTPPPGRSWALFAEATAVLKAFPTP